MTWGRRESKGESKEIRWKVVIQEGDDGVHRRWNTEEITDGVARWDCIEVRLVGLAAILHKAFRREREADNTKVL